MELKLSVQERAKNEKLDKDFMPAVVYGKDRATRSLKLKRIEFEKIFGLAGESNLVELNDGVKTTKVLIKDIQRDVLKHTFTHVDFLQVNMKEKIHTAIPLHFIGESKAIKELNGSLMKEVHELEVECMPGDLVDHIDVDISVLETFDDVIKISDVKLPTNVKSLHITNDVVAIVAIPKAQVEETPVVAEPVVDSKAAVADSKAAPAGEGKNEKKDNKK